MVGGIIRNVIRNATIDWDTGEMIELPSISEHFPQALFLVGTQRRIRLQIYIDIFVDRIVPEKIIVRNSNDATTETLAV